MAVFDTATLLNSNLKGGKSKINKESGKHQALNPDLIKAIKYTVQESHPARYNESVLNIAISNKLSCLRNNYKKKVANNNENSGTNHVSTDSEDDQ